MLRPESIKPGIFGITVAADTRRGIFDAHNESLLARNSTVDAVFIGDSITEMWALDAYFEGASGILVNRGIGGDISTYVRKRFKADVLQVHPSLAVLEIGTNNLWDLDLLTDSSIQQGAQEIEHGIVSDISSMVNSALGQNISVALCGILPTNLRNSGTNVVRNEAIVRINSRLERLASQLQHVVYVDYHSHFVADDGRTLRDGLADDGLHPHSIGYQIMADVLLRTLKEAGVTSIQSRS